MNFRRQLFRTVKELSSQQQKQAKVALLRQIRPVRRQTAPRPFIGNWVAELDDTFGNFQLQPTS